MAPMEDVSVMGVVEVLGKLGPIRRARAALESALDERPDGLLVVDSPDLHLPLARKARDRGIPVIGYVSPQVWAWRPGRVDGIAQALDALLCLFSFEPPLYAVAADKHGCDVRWTGHPVVDRLPPRTTVLPDHYGLLPGSRAQELARHRAHFFDAARRIKDQRPGAHFTVVVPPAMLPHLGEIPDGCSISHEVTDLRRCRAALTKSGTVTLELAAMGVPMVVAHRVAAVTHALGRRLVTGLRHIALPNILADREVVPEVVQHLDGADLADRVLGLPLVQPLDLTPLGPSGASARAAAAVRDVLAR